MRYGNTFTSLRREMLTPVLFGLGLALVVWVFHLCGQAPHVTWRGLVLVAFLPVTAVVVACLPTLLFSIRLEAGRVRHVMLDRYVLSDFPLADFEQMQRSRGPWAAKLVFAGGRSIRFFGAHMGILAALEQDLEAVRPRRR